MALEFKIKDFAYPIGIVKLRYTFEKTQWFTEEQQTLYQEQLLRRIVEHAYRHVPYYQNLFDKIRLRPGDIQRISDLEKIPILTKATLHTQFKRLEATNSHAFHPQVLYTSGTTGRRLQFLVDRPSNILEFVYYWRYWNWAGYRLGARFAEFSSVFFSRNHDKAHLLTYYKRAANRLLLNSSAISQASVKEYAKAIRKHRPLFLKGMPSILYYFSLFLQQRGVDDIVFKAVFSMGEVLLPRFRKLIEETFRCKVYDSYGHMERTVAISECPLGGLHINPDYGLLELDRQSTFRAGISETNCDGSSYSAKVIGTTLYNFSMPLIRYDVGDFVLVDPKKKCECGRQFPIVSAIDGRQSEVIRTTEGKIITAAFLIFEDLPDILAGQLVQESLTELRVQIVPAPSFSQAGEAQLIRRLQTLLGPAMKISINRCESTDLIRGRSNKILSVVSYVGGIQS